MIDFYAFSDRLFPIDRLSMDALMNSEWRRKAILPWVPRLQRFVERLEADMDSLVIVEGFFRLNEVGKALMVTALMRWCPELRDGEKYKVVNSFFSVVTRGRRKSL